MNFLRWILTILRRPLRRNEPGQPDSCPFPVTAPTHHDPHRGPKLSLGLCDELDEGRFLAGRRPGDLG
jgi:hypothetical protein